MKPRALALVAPFVTLGCRDLPYQPQELLLPPGEAAFACLADAIRVRFPRLVVCDPAERRLQSAWTDVDSGAAVGRRRVTVFPVDAARIGIVVEVSWARLGLSGTPYWTTRAGDPAVERELADAVRTRLDELGGQ